MQIDLWSKEELEEQSNEAESEEKPITHNEESIETQTKSFENDCWKFGEDKKIHSPNYSLNNSQECYDEEDKVDQLKEHTLSKSNNEDTYLLKDSKDDQGLMKIILELMKKL